MTTSAADPQSSRLFDELQLGDHVEVTHSVLVGSRQWFTTAIGTVVRKERRLHGLHFRRRDDDKVYSDLLILRKDDGELTTLTMDEYTQLRRIQLQGVR
jgi:hypothetical protein